MFWSLVISILSGCATPPHAPPPSADLTIRHEPWDPKYPQTRCLISPHYRIYTDITDSHTLQHLPRLMESAFEQYQLLTPGRPLSNHPLMCYIFADRPQWAAFTAKNTGADAAIYLKISRGAYTIDDWFVAFWIGERATFAVAAHEGWHQFAARNYAGRMAPAIEEGIACIFEDVDFASTTPRWNTAPTPARRRALHQAFATGSILPLDRLLQLHAGDVINLPRPRIEAFYAQTWALAMFLQEADGGAYRPAFQQYLNDVANAQAWRPTKLAHLKQREWHPLMAGAQLPHYLNLPLPELDRRYQRYCRTLAHPAR